METCGYDEIVIDDFYDTFITALKKLDSIKKIDAQEHLMAVLCNHDSANYLIMYARFMAACFLKKNAILYEGFVGDVHAFCTKEVEQLDVEADHPQIMAITGYFNMGVEINSVTHTGSIDVLNLPEEGYSGFRPKLLFVPGHYDALY